MSYKAPGAYARFVNAPSPVATAGEVRALALIGTGETSYDVVNEGVGRGSTGISDKLSNKNILSVNSVTQKPLYQGSVIPGSTSYSKGTYDSVTGGVMAFHDVSGGDYAIVTETDKESYIVWKLKTEGSGATLEPDFDAPTITDGSTVGSASFAGDTGASPNIVIVIDYTKLYLLKQGAYRFEVTHVGGAGTGLYSVINETTREVVGEFTANSTTPQENVIEGLKITVKATNTANTAINDYFTLTVKAPEVQGVVGAKTLPTPNNSYYVSYSYGKEQAEYGPKVFYDYNDVVAAYGNYDIAANGRVVNSLALAAQVAFENGVSPIVCVQSQSETEGAYKTAIDSLNKPFFGLRNVSAIVALTDHLSAPQHENVSVYLKQHVEDMALPINAKERMAYVSSHKDATYASFVTGAILSGNAPIYKYNSERVVFVVPGTVNKEIKDIRTGRFNTRVIGGSYLAVAAASVALSNDPAEPLTNKSVIGFGNLGTLFSEQEMNYLAEAGCLVFKQDGTIVRVRHGITTSVLDVNSQEITLVQIKDFVMDSVRLRLGEAYIGNKMKPTIVSDIESTLNSILSGFQAKGIILGYAGVKVSKSSLDSRQVDVRFEIEAVYPLNYIDISFSFSGVN
jgi:hypothetical protein